MKDFKTQLTIAAAAAELAGEARAIADYAELRGEPAELERELAEDLVTVAFVAFVELDELAKFHKQHDHAKPAAPAWMVKGGAA